MVTLGLLQGLNRRAYAAYENWFVGINTQIDRYFGALREGMNLFCSPSEFCGLTLLRYFAAEMTKGVVGTLAALPMLIDNPLLLITGFAALPGEFYRGARVLFDAEASAQAKWGMLGIMLASGAGLFLRRLPREIPDHFRPAVSDRTLPRTELQLLSCDLVLKIQVLPEGMCCVSGFLHSAQSRQLGGGSLPLKSTLGDLDSLRLVKRDSGIVLQIEGAQGKGEFHFAQGTPMHRFLADNATLWNHGSSGPQVCQTVHLLAETSRPLTLAISQTGRFSYMTPSVCGPMGGRVAFVKSWQKMGSSPVWIMYEDFPNGTLQRLVFTTADAYVSHVAGSHYKVTLPFLTHSNQVAANGSILVAESSPLGALLKQEWLRLEGTNVIGVRIADRDLLDRLWGELAQDGQSHSRAALRHHNVEKRLEAALAHPQTGAASTVQIVRQALFEGTGGTYLS